MTLRSRPYTAFWISMAGALIALGLGPLGGALLGTRVFQFLTNEPAAGGVGAWLFLLLGLLFGGGMVLGAALILDDDREYVRFAATLLVVFTLVGIPFTVFGWVVGGVLALLGAWLAFRWEPPLA